MNVRKVSLTAGVLVLCFVGGAAVRVFYAPEVDVEHARIVSLVRELVSELRTEELIDIEHDEVMGFATENAPDLAEAYEQSKARYFEQELEIKSLIENNYERDELEKILGDPEKAEVLVYACPEYDGRLVPIPLDPADWPDIFPRGRFGYEPRDALKEHIYERYFEGQGPKGGELSAHH